MSLLGIAFLNEIVGRQEVNTPGEVLDLLRELVKTSLQQTGLKEEQKDGIDMAFCSYNQNNNTLLYAGANNPVIVQKSGVMTEYKPTKNPIGIYLKEKHFENHVIEIIKGDSLYLFSDGITDQVGGETGRKLKLNKLYKVFEDNQHLKMEEQQNALTLMLDSWTNDKYKQIDDILVVGIRF